VVVVEPVHAWRCFAQTHVAKLIEEFLVGGKLERAVADRAVQI